MKEEVMIMIWRWWVKRIMVKLSKMQSFDLWNGGASGISQVGGGGCLAVAGNRCALIATAAQVSGWETICAGQPAVSLQRSTSCRLKSCQPVIRKPERRVRSETLLGKLSGSQPQGSVVIMYLGDKTFMSRTTVDGSFGPCSGNKMGSFRS